MISIPQDASFNEVTYLINSFSYLKKFNFGAKLGQKYHSAMPYRTYGNPGHFAIV